MNMAEKVEKYIVITAKAQPQINYWQFKIMLQVFGKCDWLVEELKFVSSYQWLTLMGSCGFVRQEIYKMIKNKNNPQLFNENIWVFNFISKPSLFSLIRFRIDTEYLTFTDELQRCTLSWEKRSIVPRWRFIPAELAPYISWPGFCPELRK